MGRTNIMIYESWSGTRAASRVQTKRAIVHEALEFTGAFGKAERHAAP